MSNEIFDRDSARRVIDELRKSGWTVETEVSGSQLPVPLKGLRADILAHRGDEILVGEFASRRSAAHEQIDAIARRVQQVPNAKFEVFWLGDSSQEPVPVENVLSFAREARIVSSVSLRAALLMAWAALEGGIVRYAGFTQRLGGWNTPWQLLTKLYSDGRIEEADFSRLSLLWKSRNEIAHHTAEAGALSLSDIEYAINIAEKFARNEYASSDEVVAWFLENYDDPAHRVPYSTADGGYQYLGSGPYDAAEVLHSQFPNIPEEIIEASLEVLEGISFEWVKKSEW